MLQRVIAHAEGLSVRLGSSYPRSAHRALCLLLLLNLSACGFSGYGVRQSPQVGAVKHRVEQGETVWEIAKRYGVSEATVLRINGMRDARQLQVGQILLLGYGSHQQPRLQNAYARKYSAPIVPRQPRSKRRIALPIRQGRLVSHFGPRNRSFHDGVDIAARTGTPVYAAHDGVVSYAGSRLRGYGKLVVIRGDDGLITVYAHSSKLLVSSGQRVRIGQKIAEVGSTGRSTGPHLHFEVRTRDKNGRLVAVDPLPLLRASGQKPRYRVNESLSPLLAKR